MSVIAATLQITASPAGFTVANGKRIAEFSFGEVSARGAAFGIGDDLDCVRFEENGSFKWRQSGLIKLRAIGAWAPFAADGARNPQPDLKAYLTRAGWIGDTSPAPAPRQTADDGPSAEERSKAAETAYEAEASRISGILTLPAAAAHPEVARRLAATPSVSVEGAKAILATLDQRSTEPRNTGRACDSELGLVFSRAGEPLPI